MERKRLRGGVMNINHYVEANLNSTTFDPSFIFSLTDAQ